MSNIIENRLADNYFKLLGLPVSFEVDRERLNDNYHDIQKSVHPDNFANTSDLQRRLSVQKAAQINDALETLKNPLRRSIYLLSLYGIDLNENDSSIDPAFLMEQMELRENLSQVGSESDPLAALDNILDDVKSRISQVIGELSRLFDKLLPDSSLEPAVQGPPEEEQLLKEVKVQVLKMQFLNRLQEECLNKEEDLAEQL
ncbi:MAG: Fe-S protein assembly co-chaperone HscB [Gammaproteobacteria bacterium]|nr:Fe-S protein assembly co-chaperone HscB [Gammaproteobacteria bacterium]